MSEQDKQLNQPEEQEPHTDEQQEGYGDEQNDNEEDEDEMYKNNHDLIGVEGIIRAQKNEIEKKKVSWNQQDTGVVGTQNWKRKVL